MVTRRVKTGGAYVGAGGLGAPSPPQWQNTYEEQEFTGAYVTDPGGGPDQWQYIGGGSPVPLLINNAVVLINDIGILINAQTYSP